MEIINSQRNVGLGILLTWCVYIAFAFLTDWKDYGLVAQPERYLRWTITRLSTVSIWLFVAGLLLRYRKHPVNWRSFSYSFVATGVIAIVISPSLVSRSVNMTAITGTIVFYALVSGFLSVTVKKPTIAAVLGLLFFTAQFFIDAIAHMFSGVFRFH
ncbi:MAG TPA: hypothetical protein VJ624_01325 [Thermodesulfobacteriota bacterium]|nr:hypothetical protein [Thermodesulfobacteriota bacterium]